MHLSSFYSCVATFTKKKLETNNFFSEGKARLKKKRNFEYKNEVMKLGFQRGTFSSDP